MIRRTHSSDELTELLFTGRTSTAGDRLDAFLADMRASGHRDVHPTGELLVLLAEGLSADKGDLPVTAASNVTGPAPQVSGLPTRRKHRMIETLLAKAAAMALATKLAAGAGAVALAGTAAAATGNLPAPAQDAFESVTAGDETEEETEEEETEEVETEEVETEVDEEDADLGSSELEEDRAADAQPDEGSFGAVVVGLVQGGDLVGEAFGLEVSRLAQEMAAEKAAEGRATGDEAGEAGRANRPEGTPSPDDNPGGTAGEGDRPSETPPPAAAHGTEARDGAGEAGQEGVEAETPEDETSHVPEGAGEQAPEGAGEQAPEGAGEQADDAGAEASGGRRP